VDAALREDGVRQKRRAFEDSLKVGRADSNAMFLASCCVCPDQKRGRSDAAGGRVAPEKGAPLRTAPR